MQNAIEIDVAEIVNPDLRFVIDTQDGDRLFDVPVGDDRAVVVRLRPGAQPHMYATSCAVLTSLALPEGWAVVCMEVTRDGIRDGKVLVRGGARDHWVVIRLLVRETVHK